MTETQERFLRAVLTRVPLDSVVEMHLFPPIRRGTLETGVAVIATALPPEPLIVIAPEDDEPLLEHDLAIAPIDMGLVASAAAAPDVADADGLAPDAVASAAPEAEALAEPWAAEAIVAADTPPRTTGAVTDDVSPYATSAAAADDVVAGDATVNGDTDAADAVTEPESGLRTLVSVDIGEALMDVEGSAEDEPPVMRSIPSPRMRIFTASYRHTIKGVERGKWTFDVHEEADAPLEAVELVLRGVRHRSTEPADPEQVSHDVLTALVTPARVAPAA